MGSGLGQAAVRAAVSIHRFYNSGPLRPGLAGGGLSGTLDGRSFAGEFFLSPLVISGM